MSSGLKGEFRVEDNPRVGAKAGGGARRQGGKGGGARARGEPLRPPPRERIEGGGVALGGRAPIPRARTGRANPPARPRLPTNPSADRGVERGLIDSNQIDASERTAYLESVQRQVSKRQYQQEVRRVNREIREKGFFKAPTGTILAGLEKSATERERRARAERPRGGDPEPRVKGGPTEGRQRRLETLPEPEPQPEPEPEILGEFDEAGFQIPSAKFEVDRVGRGSNVDEFEEPLQRRRQTQRTPTAKADPFAQIGGVGQIQERLRTGGSAGGLPKQRSAPAGGSAGRSPAQILAEARENFVAGSGLQRARSVADPIGGGISLQPSDAAQLLIKERARRTQRELESAPLGREQAPPEPSTPPPRQTVRERVTAGLRSFAGQ